RRKEIGVIEHRNNGGALAAIPNPTRTNLTRVPQKTRHPLLFLCLSSCFLSDLKVKHLRPKLSCLRDAHFRSRREILDIPLGGLPRVDPVKCAPSQYPHAASSLPVASMSETSKEVLAERVEQRRTFAIISHPDAGKTTLTEKLLLFAGAIHIAGSVKARKATRHATSDWMEIEKQRGISVASSVMQMEYRGKVVNLLDTPGHKDFSEDTYRVLTAVDAALMVIDAANGVEAQTLRLLEVCRSRGTPIITFINKMDREVREPLDLIDEIEKALGMSVVPITWPIGMGKSFRGVYDLAKNRIRVFRPGEDRLDFEEEIVSGLDDPSLAARFGDEFARARNDIELVRGASPAFSREEFLAGRQTPAFFGSAINNFGVREVLDALVDIAPPPQPRVALQGEVDPHDPQFSAVVFKIQANMDPAHRD